MIYIFLLWKQWVIINILDRDYQCHAMISFFAQVKEDTIEQTINKNRKLANKQMNWCWTNATFNTIVSVTQWSDFCAQPLRRESSSSPSSSSSSSPSSSSSSSPPLENTVILFFAQVLWRGQGWEWKTDSGPHSLIPDKRNTNSKQLIDYFKQTNIKQSLQIETNMQTLLWIQIYL